MLPVARVRHLVPLPLRRAGVRVVAARRAARVERTLAKLAGDGRPILAGPWLGEVGQPAFYRQIEQTDERFLREIEERLGEIAIPVRILWGAQDEWIAPDTARRLADLIPAASLRLVDGAGHLVHYDAPAALADELRRWLT